jgi:DDE superfamily endonuclease
MAAASSSPSMVEVVLRVGKLLSGQLVDTKADAYRVVAAEMGVSFERVKTAFRRHGISATQSPVNLRAHGHCMFTSAQEAALVGLIRGMYQSEQPTTRANIQVVARLWARRCGVPEEVSDNLSKMWVSRFIARHSDRLARRSAQGLADKRSSRRVTHEVEQFVQTLNLHIGSCGGETAGWNWKPEVVLNADETRFTYGDGKSLVVVPKDAQKVSTPVYRDRTALTVIPFAAASGDVVFTALVYKHVALANGDTVIPKWLSFDSGKRPLRGDRHYYYGMWSSDTGFVNGEIWRSIMESFVAAARLQYPEGLQLHLLLDNLGAHHDMKSLLHAANNNVNVIFFPRNTTHKLQPLDDVAFAGCKLAAVAIRSALNTAFSLCFPNAKASRYSFNLQATYQSLHHHLSPAAIRASFRNTGLLPFRPELILARNGGRQEGAQVDQSTLFSQVVKSTAAGMCEVFCEFREEQRPEVVETIGAVVPGTPRPILASDILATHQAREEERKQRVLEKASQKRKRAGTYSVPSFSRSGVFLH